MPEELNIDADPFLKLLTDALRAGPTSAEWRDAVAQLNAGDIADREQYQVLVEARENLESGKPYRSIRAGAGFTRKLEGQLGALTADADTSRTKSPLSASFISYVGVALIVGVVAVLVMHLSGSATVDLSGTMFNTTLSAKLEGPLPPGWRRIGSLPVDAANGLYPGPNDSSNPYLGGGLIATSGIAPGDVFAIEATFHFQHVSNGLIPQLFVTDTNDFTSPTTVSPHEIAWLVRDHQGQVVLPGDKLVGTSTHISDNSTVTVQIRIGMDQAMVLVNGNAVWSGTSQLADTTRYPGVRLLRQGSDKRDVVTVKNVRVLQR